MIKDQPFDFKEFLGLSVALTLFAALMAWVVDGDWTWWGNLGHRSVLLGSVIAMLLFVLPVYLVSHKWLRLETFYELTQRLHMMARHFSWPQIMVISMLAGIGEELLFRGALQTWLHSVIGPLTAIVLSSLVFGLLHALTWYYFIFTLLLSLVLGSIFYHTQNMILLVTIHAVYDIIALGVIAKAPHLLGVKSDSGSNIRV